MSESLDGAPVFPETVRTDSLRLAPLSPDTVDVFEFYDLFAASAEATQDVYEFLPMEPFGTPKDARDLLEGAVAEWADADAAKYGVWPGEDDVAGMAALSPDWERRRASLAVILAKQYWGQGYAGECATALAAVAFDRLDLELVTLGYDEGNERSARAIEKFVDRWGGQYDGVRRNETVRGDEVVDAHEYSVTREAFRRARTEE